MSNTIYAIINWVSALMIVELGVILAFFRTKEGPEFNKYNTAKTWLSIACVTLGVLTAVNQLVPTDVNSSMWLQAVTLCISALQAMMFTMTILSIVASKKVTWRYVLGQVVLIIAASVCVIAGCNISPTMGRTALVIGIIAYLALLGYYAWMFINSYRKFRQEINTYYEEDEIDYSLRWLRRLFWTAFTVGILSFLSLTGKHWLDMIFIIIYTLFYIYFAIHFINYHRQLLIVQPAIAKAEKNNDAKVPEQEVSSDEDEEKALKTRMEKTLKHWINEKRFTAYDKSVSEVAKEMGCSINELHWYFREVLQTNFSSWRNQLRVEMAKKLLSEQPDMTVQDVAAECGFNNRSYFYRKFTEVTGMSVQDYKNENGGISPRSIAKDNNKFGNPGALW